jgi:hypothetical protein
VEQPYYSSVEEEVDLAVFGSEFNTVARVYPELCVLTQLSLDDHWERNKARKKIEYD